MGNEKAGFILLGIVATLTLAVGIGAFYFVNYFAPSPEEPASVIELCTQARDQLKAAVACKDDYNCELTYDQYYDFALIDRFGRSYCNDEPKTSPIPKESTGDQETYTR